MHDELLGSPLHGFNPPHGPKDSTSGTRYAQPVVNDGKGEVMQDLGNSVCYHDVNYLLLSFPPFQLVLRKGWQVETTDNGASMWWVSLQCPF